MGWVWAQWSGCLHQIARRSAVPFSETTLLRGRQISARANPSRQLALRTVRLQQSRERTSSAHSILRRCFHSGRAYRDWHVVVPQTLRGRPLYGAAAISIGVLLGAAVYLLDPRNAITQLTDAPHSSPKAAPGPTPPQPSQQSIDSGPTSGEKGIAERTAEKLNATVPAKPSEDREWSSYIPMPDAISNIGERLTDIVLPSWVSALPGFIDKLQGELSAEPGTLAEEIWAEAQDPVLNPEIMRPASVRISSSLCDEELDFLSKRKLHTRLALAKYLDLDENSIHLDDVPTIAMCGSGGGLRAMVAGTSSYTAAQEHGLFDCVTYTAGVSGSCWLQAVYFSTIANQDFGRLLNHLKSRLGVHIAFPPTLLRLVTSSPTSKFLLCGAYEKYRGVQNADFGLVDAYGVMLGARLLVPRGDLGIDPANLKLSNQTTYLRDGKHPMPIYTAVRHEIPEPEAKDPEGHTSEAAKEAARREAWFQWFEFTPYELFCEEFGAGIPTWATGRDFDKGRTLLPDKDHQPALPELRLPLLMGIWASAFCATLAHYYKEIRPLVAGLSGLGGLDGLISGRNEDLVKVHPIDPATIPNFVRGLAGQLPSTTSASMYKTPTLQLMDAGMSNNLPIYPMLRPGRNVDVVVAFDASADISRENWLRVVDGYARQRNIKGWPVGAGWPGEPEQLESDAQKADSPEGKQVQAKLDAADTANVNKDQPKQKVPDLTHCNVWVGSTRERTTGREPPQSKLVEDHWDLLEPDAGIAVVYFPFIENPAKVPGVNPQTSAGAEYMSTWNFVYTPEDIDTVVRLARANFEEGASKTKMVVRAVYERKKRRRLEREAKEKGGKQWWQAIFQNRDDF